MVVFPSVTPPSTTSRPLAADTAEPHRSSGRFAIAFHPVLVGSKANPSENPTRSAPPAQYTTPSMPPQEVNATLCGYAGCALNVHVDGSKPTTSFEVVQLLSVQPPTR